MHVTVNHLLPYLFYFTSIIYVYCICVAVPSPELVDRVRDLYQKRVSDVRFLIPVLNGLSKVNIAVLCKYCIRMLRLFCVVKMMLVSVSPLSICLTCNFSLLLSSGICALFAERSCGCIAKVDQAESGCR